MADTGLKSAGAGSGTDWTNPGDVTSSDDNRAIYTGSGQADHYSTTFGFTVTDIPSGAQIDGVMVSVEGQSLEGPPTARDIDVALTTDGSSVAGTRKLAVIRQDRNADNTYTAGGATDGWSASLSDTDIVGNSSFGAMIRCNIAAKDVKLDHVQITVYYTVFNALTKIVPTEDVDLTETTEHHAPLVRFASSTVGVTEKIDAVGIEKLAFANDTGFIETSSFLGQLSVLGFVKLAPTETVDIGDEALDVLSGGAALVKFADDTEGIGETVNRLRTMARFADDTEGITETAQRLRMMVRFASDSVALTEDTLAILGMVRLVSETGSITEAVSRLREMARFIDEGGDITETATRARTLARMVPDAVDISDEALRAREMVRFIAEALGITETVVDAQDWVSLVNELVGIAEGTVVWSQSYPVPGPGDRTTIKDVAMGQITMPAVEWVSDLAPPTSWSAKTPAISDWQGVITVAPVWVVVKSNLLIVAAVLGWYTAGGLEAINDDVENEADITRTCQASGIAASGSFVARIDKTATAPHWKGKHRLRVRVGTTAGEAEGEWPAISFSVYWNHSGDNAFVGSNNPKVDYRLLNVSVSPLMLDGETRFYEWTFTVEDAIDAATDEVTGLPSDWYEVWGTYPKGPLGSIRAGLYVAVGGTRAGSELGDNSGACLYALDTVFKVTAPYTVVGKGEATYTTEDEPDTTWTPDPDKPPTPWS